MGSPSRRRSPWRARPRRPSSTSLRQPRRSSSPAPAHPSTSPRSPWPPCAHAAVCPPWPCRCRRSLLRPEGVLASGDLARQPLVVVSRSGSTTEALDVVRAAKARSQPTIAVTCRPGSPMAALADATLAVPEGDETAIVMTRSFVAQVSLLLGLGARVDARRTGRDDTLPRRPRGRARSLDGARAIRRAGPGAGHG